MKEFYPEGLLEKNKENRQLLSDISLISGCAGSDTVLEAKAYMCDPDAPEGKVFDLWLAQV